ncbi:MAG: glycine--tRNA ligase subunit beta [Proteobacteria bacterium]|nr:glycine--tRNA ligase subunit beta [Pseudomonadota bacterium]
MAEASRPLLVELGVEELPIRAVDGLAQAFARGICDGLARRGITFDADAARHYCTPRRLAAYVPKVAGTQPQQQTESFGPYVNLALDPQGQPTRALLGFAQKAGVDWSQLQRATDARGERFVHRAVQPGQSLAALLPRIVAEALAALPVPKPMRWGDHDDSFVRPVHWLVMLHGNDIVDGEVMGLRSGRQSRGHRFLHAKPVHLADADSYVDALRAAKVLADPVERRTSIREQTRTAGAGSAPRLSDSLCDEIANLVEWPVAVACTFDRDYLAVPHEALVMTMEANQKFVPVFDTQGMLTERFIGVANIESKDPAQIRRGYERVIRPRFADAKFFFDEDLKTPLASHQQGLRDVTWQKALGSLWDKTVRVAELARAIANRVRESGTHVDAALATHAAALSRCDLLTRMVGEFPELQGVMGRHYATAQGERGDVAEALDQFYRPRNAEDGIAQGALAQVLSIADKLDTLAGIFAIGQKPSGNKDPFALRRAALGLARTLIEGAIELDLRVWLREALEQVPESVFLPSHGGKGAGSEGTKLARGHEPSPGAARVTLAEELYIFILDRLRGYYAERGFTPQQFEAVAAVQPASLFDFDRRLRAVAAFAQRPEAGHLAAANKRVANILRKEGIDARAAAAQPIDEAHLREPAERELWRALQAARQQSSSGDHAGYESRLARLAQLQAPVDGFFDTVLVMDEDAALRANRIRLLAQVKAQFDAIADIALL